MLEVWLFCTRLTHLATQSSADEHAIVADAILLRPMYVIIEVARITFKVLL